MTEQLMANSHATNLAYPDNHVGVSLVCMNIVDAFIKSGKISLSRDHELRISRRGLLAGLVASAVVLRGVGTAATESKPISPIDLGDGLEIRDYRLFPTKDLMRFIVEIHNT